MVAFRMSPVGKYLALRTLATRVLGFWRIRQSCLARKALLKSCKFLKPIPPLVFCLHMVFQLTQHILVSCCRWPHQKFLIILSISSHRLWGRRTHPMVYVGIAWATALMRISFPPMERSFLFHPASFCPILSYRIANTCVFDLPIKDGRPKYFVCLVSCIGPRLAKISSLAS